MYKDVRFSITLKIREGVGCSAVIKSQPGGETPSEQRWHHSEGSRSLVGQSGDHGRGEGGGVKGCDVIPFPLKLTRV